MLGKQSIENQNKVSVGSLKPELLPFGAVVLEGSGVPDDFSVVLFFSFKAGWVEDLSIF